MSCVVSNYIILLLSLTTVIFAVLFWLYYSSYDQFMKDKETMLVNKERELNERELKVGNCEMHVSMSGKLKSSMDKIKTIVSEY